MNTEVDLYDFSDANRELGFAQCQVWAEPNVAQTK